LQSANPGAYRRTGAFAAGYLLAGSALTDRAAGGGAVLLVAGVRLAAPG